MSRHSIPQRIFQTWKSKTDLPPNFAHWRRSFLANNPGYAFDLWDDADNRAFIARHFPWFLRVYDAYPAEIYRADTIRYFYLYMFGGLYADLDTQCLKPLDQVLDRSGVVLGRMGADPTFEHSIPNAIMASTPREEFWLFVIGKAMVAAEWPASPEATTGPIFLRQAVLSYWRADPPPAQVIGLMKRLLSTDLMPVPNISVLHVLPPDEWFPVNWDDEQGTAIRSRVLGRNLLNVTEARELFPNSSLVTYWTNSWFVGPQRPWPEQRSESYC